MENTLKQVILYDCSILIVIPAFNEDTTISQVVKNCKKFGDVLVINDGSIDKTHVFSKKLWRNCFIKQKEFWIRVLTKCWSCICAQKSI